jgi:acetoin utilization deacetylase AcuC-like enzyme
MVTIHYDERVLRHDTGRALHEAEASPWIGSPEPHTEGPARLAAMVDVLREGPLRDRLRWAGGRPATSEELQWIHPASYIEELRRRCEGGGGWVTVTTRLGADSFEPLLVAAGTALEAGRTVLEGGSSAAYALVRPPGHHAQIAQVDGYCFFNHAALVAEQALRAGLERVMVVDWDVHHGNGTQDVFYGRSDVLTCSIHMDHGPWGPTHPQTGWTDEVGRDAGRGYNVNVPLPLGSGDTAYLRALDEVVLPAARAFRPELIVAASGQDASAFDPNGRHNVTMAGFRGIGIRLAAMADEFCEGRLVGVQEGGYNPAYAAYCLLATLEGLLGAEPTADPLAYVPDQTLGVDAAIAAARTVVTELERSLATD